MIFRGEEKARQEERIEILEMKIRRLEKIQEGSNYVPDPRGICWQYHYIDCNGRIIEKR